MSGGRLARGNNGYPFDVATVGFSVVDEQAGDISPVGRANNSIDLCYGRI